MRLYRCCAGSRKKENTNYRKKISLSNKTNMKTKNKDDAMEKIEVMQRIYNACSLETLKNIESSVVPEKCKKEPEKNDER